MNIRTYEDSITLLNYERVLLLENFDSQASHERTRK